MTTLLALLFTAAALFIIAQPLFTRRGSAMLKSREPGVQEAEERYRNALADLRDLELDHELGNLATSEYEELRERYRVRAAAALRDLDQEQARRERYRAEIERQLAERTRGERLEGRGERGTGPHPNPFDKLRTGSLPEGEGTAGPSGPRLPSAQHSALSTR